MNEEYDVIVLGTGLKECILSGLMSVSGKKVLHVDRNSYYGGESASLNIEQLWQKFKPEEEAPKLGRGWSVDLCPKFMMACGNLVKVLLTTKVTIYLVIMSVNGSFVAKDGKAHKVPSTPAEALSSGLLGFFQKRKFRNFLNFVNDWDENIPKTHCGMNIHKTTSREVFKYYGLDNNTISFTGHALALYQNDDYLDQPAYEMVQKVKLYAFSVSKYGNSPYIYPRWGLGGLPEGFSRLGAVHGGIFMLSQPVDEVLYGDDGKACGIRCGEDTARCKQLIGDPTYFKNTDKIEKVGQVARCICILNHPIKNTNNADSCQLIIPQSQTGRKNDIYISCLGAGMDVCKAGYYIAVLTTPVETDEKNARNELKPAFDLVGDVLHEFFWVSDSFRPTSDGTKDQTFISTSYDATTHFESATEEVIRMYKNITGEDLDLNIKADPEDLEM